MCGIVGAFSKNNKPVNDWITDTFQDQLDRGTRGFGAVTFDKLTHKVFRSTEPAKILVDLALNKSSNIMFHHRMPSSSENKLSQTHPILVTHPLFKHSYLIIHNGVIHNDDEMKKVHEGLGFVYNTYLKTKEDANYVWGTFNDSEALAIELARFMEGEIKKIGAEGSMAFIGLQIKGKKVVKIFFGRNSSPLNMLLNKKGLFLSSEGEGHEIEANKLFKYNLTNYALESIPLEFLAYSPPPTNYNYNWKKDWHKGRGANSEIEKSHQARLIGFNQPHYEKDYNYDTPYSETDEYEEAVDILDDFFTQTAIPQNINQIATLVDDYAKQLKVVMQKACQKERNLALNNVPVTTPNYDD